MVKFPEITLLLPAVAEALSLIPPFPPLPTVMAYCCPAVNVVAVNTTTLPPPPPPAPSNVPFVYPPPPPPPTATTVGVALLANVRLVVFDKSVIISIVYPLPIAVLVMVDRPPLF
jgi:hypothetical protein